MLRAARRGERRENAMKLSEDQVRQFETEGWLFLPETFSPEEVAALREESEAIYREQRPEVWREKSGAPRTAFAAHLYNEAFRLLGAHPRMISRSSRSSANSSTCTSSRSTRRPPSPARSGSGTRTTAPGCATTACPSRGP
jgi:hypothetical protein